MKLGYPCINWNIGCTANSTFRLKSYSKQRLIDTVTANLACLERILAWNKQHNLLFFRLGSQLVPFASHPVCRFNWHKHFKDQFKQIGTYIKKNKMRISMHPDQFVLLNSPDTGVTKRSIKEVQYHCDVLDLMGLDATAKVQLHVGGRYGDKPAAIERFVQRYKKLSPQVKKRLVIENDHISYTLHDCLSIHRQTGIPLVFDNLHHAILNNHEPVRAAVLSAKKTWKKKDGVLMVDYSEQKKGGSRGSHADSITLSSFKTFLRQTKGLNFDVMLEIKDKETSALQAIQYL